MAQVPAFLTPRRETQIEYLMPAVGLTQAQQLQEFREQTNVGELPASVH